MLTGTFVSVGQVRLSTYPEGVLIEDTRTGSAVIASVPDVRDLLVDGPRFRRFPVGPPPSKSSGFPAFAVVGNNDEGDFFVWFDGGTASTFPLDRLRNWVGRNYCRVCNEGPNPNNLSRDRLCGGCEGDLR